MRRPILFAAACMLAAAPVSAQQNDTLRLSIQDAVARAFRTSDEARLSAAQVDIAEAQADVARAAGLPQLRINSSFVHTYASARGSAVGAVFNQPNTYTASAVLSQPLFQGGRIFAATRAARDVRASARLDQQEVRSRLAVDVQRAYLAVLFASRVAELQDTNLTLAQRRLEQVMQLEGAGRAARYDVLRARVERANIEPIVIQARSDRELAMLELKRLLNVPLDQPMRLTTRLDATAVAALAGAVEDTTTAAARPAVHSAELAARARREAVTIARADLLPSLSFSFQSGFSAFPPFGFGVPTSGGRIGTEFCPDPGTATRGCQNGGWFADRSLSATVSIPVFDGLRTQANIDLARAQLRVAELQVQQRREDVSLEVEQARAELRRARAVFAAQQQNASEAQEAFQLASLRFSRGLSTQLETSDAQLALLTARSSEARATYDLYLASAELARALGRPIPFPPTSATLQDGGSPQGNSSAN